ncbi:MAG: glutamine synthetase [Nocardioidaceae bacterium]|nr:glutamine synthetase [Nocardioidaceae bacterium]
MDTAEREARSRDAEKTLEALEAAGVVAVAATFVDNSGITRVKSVPLDRFAHLAGWGVGISTSFDRFRFDDWIAGDGEGLEPVGDLRIIPDVRRIVPLVAQPGWAWAPADRYEQSGEPHSQCSRLLLARLVDELAGQGLTARTAFEVEWVVSAGDGDDFVPGVTGPGYSMTRLINRSTYCRDVLTALHDEGVRVEQFHPEYAAGQLELSVPPEDPVSAADTSVLVRSTIRAVGAIHGLRTSYSPKVAVPGVGNGGHVHLSLWRDETNVFSGGDGRFGLTDTAESFSAGVLTRLPALLALGAPSPVSYLRLVPSHWAGVYACWGLENREAAMRMVTGSTGSEAHAANMEVKCFDLLANPYLLLSGLVASGLAGLVDGARLPEPIDVDPAALGEDILAGRDIKRLPTSLREALDAFRADTTLTKAFGPALVASIAAVRESELALFEGASEEDLAAATRWAH